MNDATETVTLRLRELADVLGVPVKRFYEAVPATNPEETAELLRLWNRLKTPRGRAAALDTLNKILNDEGQ